MLSAKKILASRVFQFIKMVEARGVEPLSEKRFTWFLRAQTVI